jgi:hypothetical protein
MPRAVKLLAVLPVRRITPTVEGVFVRERVGIALRATPTMSVAKVGLQRVHSMQTAERLGSVQVASKILARTCRALFRNILIGLVAACGMAANAAILQYNATALGGGLWRYEYTLEGAAPAGGFDGLTIYFEASSYAQLANPVTPLDWDPLVVQPDTGIPADGFLDLLNLDGLLTGNVGPVEFSVDVEYLGVGVPGSQRFELYQSTPFDVVALGQAGAANDVPEPATGALVVLALGGVMLTRARFADRANRQL